MRDFVEQWKTGGKEKSESSKYWIGLLQALGVENTFEFIQFEKPVKDGNRTINIDAYIPDTKVLIEMKSSNVDLDEAVMQSEGIKMTPYEQAQKYILHLPYSERPKYVVTCNFKELRYYDMEQPDRMHQIFIEDFNTQTSRLAFLYKENAPLLDAQERVSKEAVQHISRLYDAFSKQYTRIDEQTARNLNMLCVRIVFCLFADDSGLFDKDQFINYIRDENVGLVRDKIIKVFKVLDTEENDRDKYDNSGVNAFPYVNGGLFKEDIIIPSITLNIMNTLNTVAKFDWSRISPTIFGAIFESTLSAKRRHENGMHYTSVKNIHKVIDNLFLNQIYEDFDKIKVISDDNKRLLELRKFQIKLSKLKFLDPACGSGNFLTETYICLRRIENDVIKLIHSINIMLYNDSPIKVNINQFYGIEIDDFAVSVARTALWIAEAQVFKETKDLGFDINFFPLKSNNNIVEANALRIDWEQVVGGVENLNYIIGNPPFLGSKKMSKEQHSEVDSIFDKKEWSRSGNFDYVLCWFKKSVDLMLKNNKIKASLVATNSICQGETVGTFWKRAIDLGININFAYTSFLWGNGSDLEASVFVVIVGFDNNNESNKYIIDSNGFVSEVNNISPYLIDADDAIVETTNVPLCDVPKMSFGCMAYDDGYLSKISVEDKKDICNKYPESEKYFRRIISAQEYLNNKERWCLWLEGVDINELKNIPPIYERIQKVKEYRLSSNSKATYEAARRPHVFLNTNQPNGRYLAIPTTQSERRDYIPLSFMNNDIICLNKVYYIENNDKSLFSVLQSDIYMFWVKLTCARLKNDINYSSGVCYNTFPFITLTSEEKSKLEQLANGILAARANHPNSSLADLYDPDKMPADLCEAHKANDNYVRSLYKLTPEDSKEKVLSTLLTLYKYLVDQKVPDDFVKVGKTDFNRDDLSDPRALTVHILDKALGVVEAHNSCGLFTYTLLKFKKFIKHIIETEYTVQKANKLLKEVNKAVDIVVGGQKSLQDSYNIFNELVNNYIDDEDNDFAKSLLNAIDDIDKFLDIQSHEKVAYNIRSMLGVKEQRRFIVSNGVENCDISEDIKSIDKNRYTVKIMDGHPFYNYIANLAVSVSFGVPTNTDMYIVEASDEIESIAEKYNVTLVINSVKGNTIVFDILLNNKICDVIYNIEDNEEIG